jgi:DNA-binding Lrp family transcriptional regulator
LDSLDIRIIREMRGGDKGSLTPFPTKINSLREVALKLGVDKETVRNRLVKLGSEGIFLGWSTMINPNLLSLSAKRIWLAFPDQDSREAAISKLEKHASVRSITNYLGNTVSFVLVLPGRLDNPNDTSSSASTGTGTLRNLVGHSGKLLHDQTIKFPPCQEETKLSPNDLKIYESIRSRFGKAQTDISIESGFSVRTVKRRFQKLTEKNALLFISAWNPQRIQGVAGELFVASKPSISAAHESDDDYDYIGTARIPSRLISKIAARLEESLMYVEAYEEPCATFSFVAKNIAEAADALKFTKSLSEVSFADLGLVQSIVRVREKLRLALPKSIVATVASSAALSG